MIDLPLRLTLDGTVLADNWRWLAARSGAAACGAAVKADGYGLGAVEVAHRLAAAGCRDFFVATWAEAAALGPLPEGIGLSVLHGVREADMATALASPARPVLNSPAQVARWRSAAPDRPCDVMVDTGMNRLGLTPAQAFSGLLDGLEIDTLLSHLASADEPDSDQNPRQLAAMRVLVGGIAARRYSLANSAGICLGADYGFDLTRPGLALYGGIPHPAAARAIRPVARIEAQVLQVREVAAGDSIGYGATYVVPPGPGARIAALNIGYADGYLRGFSNRGRLFAGGCMCPVVGRVSMDLLMVDIGDAEVGEGDWLMLDPDLDEASARSGVSQYELLTGLGRRYQRRWT